MVKSSMVAVVAALSFLPSPGSAREARLAYAPPQASSKIEDRISLAFLPEVNARTQENFIDSTMQPLATVTVAKRCAAVDPQQVSMLVRSLAAEEGLDPDLADAVAWVESGYGANVDPSASGALGIMQLMPATAKDLGLVDRCDAEQNIRAGVRYMKQLYSEFKDPVLMLAAYNAGPAKVYEKKGIPLYRETSDYIVRVLNRWKFSAMVGQRDQSIAQVKPVRNTAKDDGDSDKAERGWKDGHVIELQ
jgi:soluble lytic murein transglycosylase-like protein